MNYYKDTDFSNKTLDGTSQHLTMYTNKAYDEYVPVREGDYTNLKITNVHHDVNLINKNFLNVTAKFNVAPTKDLLFEAMFFKYGMTQTEVEADITAALRGGGAPVLTPDLGKKMYIGWKNSGEIIEEMTVYNNGHETGYQQIHADRENYLESTKFITSSDKDLKRDCHFAYYYYKNNMEGEVPGLLIEDISTVKAERNIFNNVTLPYHLKDKKIIPLNDTFIGLYTGLAATTDLNKPGTVSDAQFKVIVDISHQESSVAQALHCEEWIDFAFDYDWDDDSTNYLANDGDGNPQGPYAIGAAGLVTMIKAIGTHKDDDKPWVPVIKAGGLETFHFLNARRWEWKTTTPYVAEVPLIIPLKDLPAFNSMEFFEKPFGDITLRMMLGPRSLLMFNELEKCKQYKNTDFTVSDFQITNLTCECYGYNLTENNDQSVWAPLKSKFGPDSERSRIYEVRFTDFKTFDTSMEGGRFNIEFPTMIEMVKYIHMTFPRSSNDTTVFRNPFLKDVKLKLDGILYPREANIRTDNRFFYHLQAKDYDLDDDVIYSYTCPALNAAKTGPLTDDNKKEDLDDTNFIMTYELATGHFMAMTKYGDNANIHFSGEIINYKQGMYGMSSSAVEYYDYEPAPQVWFTHDSCWKLNFRDGLTFMKQTCPSYDLYNSNGEDVYYMT